MKTNKITYVLVSMLVLTGLALSSGVANAAFDLKAWFKGNVKAEEKIENKIEKVENKFEERMDKLTGKPDHVKVSVASNVSLSANGKVNVVGAKVTAVSGNTVTASSTLGSATLNWTINANADTKINGSNTSGNTITNISVGDTINFQGILTASSGSSLSLTATSIKDLSIVREPVRTTLAGAIKSIAGTVAPTTMVVASGNVDYTANIATSTSVLGSTWLTLPLSSFQVGNKVTVYGTINANNTIDATVVRNNNVR
ncbi:MAG TPA: hypothetical protein VJB95_01095 [Candidatus Paceibacterota bacterium]